MRHHFSKQLFLQVFDGAAKRGFTASSIREENRIGTRHDIQEPAESCVPSLFLRPVYEAFYEVRGFGLFEEDGGGGNWRDDRPLRRSNSRDGEGAGSEGGDDWRGAALSRRSAPGPPLPCLRSPPALLAARDAAADTFDRLRLCAVRETPHPLRPPSSFHEKSSKERSEQGRKERLEGTVLPAYCNDVFVREGHVQASLLLSSSPLLLLLLHLSSR